MYQLAPESAFCTLSRLGTGFLVALALSIALSSRAQIPSFGTGVQIGTVENSSIWEASGIIASRQNPGVLWTHNDSGFAGSIFAVATNGAYLARYFVPDVFFGDFEDISFGPGPLPQFQYIYLGDIGDNFLTRESIRVLRFPEPAVYAYQSNAPVDASVFAPQEITLRYPDGSFNAEAMTVDPITGDLFIATKNSVTSRLYRASRAELDSGEPVTLTFVRELAFRSVSALDISQDGSMVAIRRPGRGGLWLRARGQSVDDALAATPFVIPVIGQPTEPNGEAIGFEPNALGYYTLSEGFMQPIYFFPRTDAVPPQPRVFIAPGEGWHYNDLGIAVGPDWRTNLTDGWFTGPAPLGYGVGERTTIWSGDESSRIPTIYFRRNFSGAVVSNLALRVCFNDGIAVYLNGVEILRRNLSPAARYEDHATARNTDQGRFWFSVPVEPSLLRTGTNVIAAEVHRFDNEGPSLIFDLQLVEARVDLPPRFTFVQVTNGMYAARISGPNGLLVRIDSSSDLREWQSNRLLTLTNGTAGFTEPATNQARFFRIRQ